MGSAASVIPMLPRDGRKFFTGVRAVGRPAIHLPFQVWSRRTPWLRLKPGKGFSPSISSGSCGSSDALPSQQQRTSQAVAAWIGVQIRPICTPHRPVAAACMTTPNGGYRAHSSDLSRAVLRRPFCLIVVSSAPPRPGAGRTVATPWSLLTVAGSVPACRHRGGRWPWRTAAWRRRASRYR
jgi:hypothetical protein